MKNYVFGGLLVTLLSACTFGVPIGDRGGDGQLTVIPPTKRTGNGNPTSYVVHGKRYYVMENAEGFRQRGIASWYGRKFHGRKTSNGETYNMYAMTAAHKTLPIPIYVRVRNLVNGESVIVKVNDRGPFIEGRIIDLSYSAAQKLDIIGTGTARVEIDALAAGPVVPASVVRPIPLADRVAEDVPLFIQVGSFGQELNAINLLRDLQDSSEPAAAIYELVTDQGLFYRVRVGPVFDIDEANALIERLREKGFDTARIVIQE